jgi:hypothetical protein
MLLLSFEKYFHEHEDPRRQNMLIMNPFVQHKETALSHQKSPSTCWIIGEQRTGKYFNSMNNSKFWIRMKKWTSSLHEIAMIFLLCFSTTYEYICETAFSAMTVLKTKQRNGLQLSDCLRLAITSVHPGINKITDRKQLKKFTSLTKTLKNSTVIKETKFDFFSNL